MKRLLIALAIASGTAVAATPIPEASFDLGFSPGGSSLQVVRSGIAAAKREILVAAYSFTSKPIAQALADAHQRGVMVEVVADEKSNDRKYSAVTFLANQGVPVRLNGNYAIFHHKYMVIDGEDVETGSFNFTAAAVRSNAENALILWHVPALASKYHDEWTRLWDEAAPLDPGD